nr:divergent polysaccharide deacetylase family protein [Sulfurimonas sp. SAG-AH-194-L11]
MENSLSKKPVPLSVSKRLKNVLKKETKSKQYVSASHEIDGSSLASVPKMAKRKKVIPSYKARLAIIIDDVGTKAQVNAIKSLRLPLTMSFLPPSKARPNTAKLAKLETLYMVHLPMEAQNWSAEEPNTLRIHDRQKVISARIKEIKELFPKVEYINNHTGSKFTSSEVAMNRLIFALNANNIHFIDSRTTAQTKAPKVLKNFGLPYVARDVFLDHHMDKAYVLEQIKKAIKVAKSHGTAIAIGHPHKNTLQALYESKELLKDVELVYINRL